MSYLAANLRAFPDHVERNNNENLDKKAENCRRKLFKRPWWSRDPRYQLLRLNDLSKALYDRFQHLGGLECPEESISCTRQGLDLCPIGDPYYSFFLSNFATTMTDRYEQLGRMEDLEEAITCLVNYLLSDPTDIPVVHRLSITSPLPCPLALGSWGE